MADPGLGRRISREAELRRLRARGERAGPGRLVLRVDAELFVIEHEELRREALRTALDDMEHFLRLRLPELIYQRPTAWIAFRQGWLGESFSFDKRVAGEGNELRAELGLRSDSPYALVQEEGGTVTPRGTYLAIPVPGSVVSHGDSPRDYDNGRFIRSKTTKKVVFGYFVGDKKARTFVPLFFMRPLIEVPGKHYLRRAFDELETFRHDVFDMIWQLYKGGIRLRKVAVQDGDVKAAAASVPIERPRKVMLRKRGVA